MYFTLVTHAATGEGDYGSTFKTIWQGETTKQAAIEVANALADTHKAPDGYVAIFSGRGDIGHFVDEVQHKDD